MTTLNTPNPKPDLPRMQSELSSRLASVAIRIRSQITFDAGVRGLAVILGLMAVSLVLDYWLELSLPIRIGYWVVTLAAAGYLLYRYGIKPLCQPLGPVEVAEAVDIARGHTGVQQIAPRVATVLQLPQQLGDESALSGQMIHDAVARSYHALEQTNFNRALSSKHVMQCVGILFAALIVPGAIGGVMHTVGENVLPTWAERWLLFQDSAYPRNTQISVEGLEDGKLYIPAGEEFTFFATVRNKDKTEVKEVRVWLDPEGKADWPQAMSNQESSRYMFKLNSIDEPTTATLRAGDQTRRFEIIPNERPKETGLKVRYRTPWDNKLRVENSLSNVMLYRDTEVELEMTTNVPIKRPRILWTGRDSKPSNSDGATRDSSGDPIIVKKGPRKYVFKWTHTKTQRFNIELISEETGLPGKPVSITVYLKRDTRPTISNFSHSGVRYNITPKALIPLDIDARDKEGLTRVGLEIDNNPEGKGEVTKLDPIELYTDADGKRTGMTLAYELDVEKLGVNVGDQVTLVANATDNCFTGPQECDPDPRKRSQRSKVFYIVDEKTLTREIDKERTTARDNFRQAIEQCKDIQLVLQQAKSGEVAANQSERFAESREMVGDVYKILQRAAVETRLNRLDGTLEDGSNIYELMQKNVLSPMKSLHERSMALQLDALQRASRMDKEQIEELDLKQKQIVATMEQILMHMEHLDSMADLLRQLEEVKHLQGLIRGKIQKMLEKQFDDIFD